jgi:O-antigen/teichoic acid export membrane protein
MSSIYNWLKDLSFTLLILAVVFGVFTLLNNWLHNALIGEQKLAEVNRINIISNGIALFALPLVFALGFWGALFVLVIQPLLFVTLCLWENKELRPTQYFLRKDYISYILSFGFIPFLGGIFIALYLQVERWSITEVLGVEALGAFYLVFLYVSLYQLVPTSINAIFFPKGVKSYSEKDYPQFKIILRYYYLILSGYGLLIALVTYTFLEPIVSLIFPNHLPGVVFVYIILPGLVMQSLSEPIGLVLNASVILRPMLIVSVVNFLICLGIVILLITANVFSLKNVAFIRTISGCFLLISYLSIYFVIKKKRLYNNGQAE